MNALNEMIIFLFNMGNTIKCISDTVGVPTVVVTRILQDSYKKEEVEDAIDIEMLDLKKAELKIDKQYVFLRGKKYEDITEYIANSHEIEAMSYTGEGLCQK